MRYVDTIIVGGGPAGSSCAWHLKRHGGPNQEVLIFDKRSFPRDKLCAGWITGKVMQDLEFLPEDYPHSFMKADIRCHIIGLPFALRGLQTAGDNYSIRRFEFDSWLLERAQSEILCHQVKSVRQDGDLYILDEQYSCRNLVGAGGTACPVARLMFPGNRKKFRQVVTLEREFEYPNRADSCHLYFGRYGTKGYAWYFPKENGYLNIGLGGKASYFKTPGISIHDTFSRFLTDLIQQNLLDGQTARNLSKSGHPYYLNSDHGEIRRGRCYLIGDAAGLATVDLGEGIGPAVESGLMAAGEILGTGHYSKGALTWYSTAGLTGYLARKIAAPRPPAPVMDKALS